jgi:hypothetical protein
MIAVQPDYVARRSNDLLLSTEFSEVTPQYPGPTPMSVRDSDWPPSGIKRFVASRKLCDNSTGGRPFTECNLLTGADDAHT